MLELKLLPNLEDNIFDFLKFCSNFEIEFVDESNTTLKIKNYNQRGKRDMLSAQFITQ